MHCLLKVDNKFTQIYLSLEEKGLKPARGSSGILCFQRDVLNQILYSYDYHQFFHYTVVFETLGDVSPI